MNAHRREAAAVAAAVASGLASYGSAEAAAGSYGRDAATFIRHIVAGNQLFDQYEFDRLYARVAGRLGLLALAEKQA